MATASFSIGQFRFVRMTGPPPIPRPTAERESRQGIDGEALWYTGHQGQPYNCETFVDVPHLDGAINLWTAYEQSVYSGLVSLVWADRLMPYQYVIEDVQLLECRRILFGMGGLNGVSYASLAARWTLRPWIPIT